MARSSPRILVEELTQDDPHYSINTMGNEVIGIAAIYFCRPLDPHLSRVHISSYAD